jgi:hypothetical protein
MNHIGSAQGLRGRVRPQEGWGTQGLALTLHKVVRPPRRTQRPSWSGIMPAKDSRTASSGPDFLSLARTEDLSALALSCAVADSMASITSCQRDERSGMLSSTTSTSCNTSIRDLDTRCQRATATATVTVPNRHCTTTTSKPGRVRTGGGG